MTENEEKESLALSCFLDSMELSHDDIMARKSLFSRLEALAGAVDFIEDYQPTTITGSTLDGVSWKGYMADLDSMILISYVTVVEDDKDAKLYPGYVFQLCTENVHPGYARLRLIKESLLGGNNIFTVTPSGVKSFCQEDNGSMYLSAFKLKSAFNRFLQLSVQPAWVVQTSYMYGVKWPDDEEILEHGPALCFSDTSKDETSNDMVPSYLCVDWPKQASEWKTRERTHWPARKDVERIVSEGCRVVPVGFRASVTRHLEWRLSFTLAERYLIKTFNNTQYKCYALLKMLLKEVIDKEVPDVLSSFNMKNTLLWTIEQSREDMWRPQMLTLAFIECLKRLCAWVKDGVSPSYFVVQNNVFDSKVVGESQAKLSKVLDEQVSKHWRCLLACESVYKQEGFLKLIGQGDTGLDMIIRDMKAENASTVWFNHDVKYFKRFEDARTELFTKLDFPDDTGMAISAHHQTLAELKGERSPTREHGRIIQPLVEAVMSSLGSHLLAYHLEQGHTSGDLLKQAQTYLENGKTSDATAGTLKLANFHFMVGDTAKCLALTESVLSKPNLLMMNIPQFLPKFIGPAESQLENYRRHFSPEQTVEERYHASAAHAVIFFPSEYHAAPDAVKFQLNSPVPKEMEYTSWLKWAVYNPNVYAHYLRFLCYFKLDQKANSERELEAIETLLEKEEVGYEVAALNLLGYSYIQVNKLEKAMQYLLQAKQKSLIPDIATLQSGGSITDLLRPEKKKTWKVCKGSM